MDTALPHSRYALLRTYRRDGTPVDTPIWFHLDGRTLVFRTKVGPKTKRLTANPRVELRVCDHRGRAAEFATAVAGRASLLSGAEAERANTALHDRYGWPTVSVHFGDETNTVDVTAADVSGRPSAPQRTRTHPRRDLV
mgnify:CR=1 FL=1